MGTICREIKCKSDALFRAAFRWWKKGRMDHRQVSHAHSTYQRKGKIPDWVREFVDYLRQTGARALPA